MKTPYLDQKIERLKELNGIERIKSINSQLQEYEAIKERLLTDEELRLILINLQEGILFSQKEMAIKQKIEKILNES